MFNKLAIVLIAIIFSGGVLIAQEKPEKKNDDQQNKSDVKTEQTSDNSEVKAEAKIWNKVCPVKGNPVEADSPTVEYNGKVYGFCCPGCDTKFEKDPEKYSKNLSEDGKRFVGRK